MKKAELESRLASIEQELKELKAILDKEPDAYAEELTSKHGGSWSNSDTWPYKVGVAQATLKYILTGEF